MSKSMLTEQRESLPYNHHLQPFLTFLKLERGFAGATIVNRERSLNPFLGWLVADVLVSVVSGTIISERSHTPLASRFRNAFEYSKCLPKPAATPLWHQAGLPRSDDPTQTARSKSQIE